MANHPELPKWVALRRSGLGSVSFSRLLARFGSIGAAWEAGESELREAGLDARYAGAVAKARKVYEPDRELELLEKAGARAVTWLDAEYPEGLADVPDAPPVLFVRGERDPGMKPAVAIVGTRKVTAYGRQVTEMFSEGLVAAGAAIVSGLARGVDTVAHRVAVERGAPTIGVMAGGVEQVYPKENTGLAERIMEVGCLVSEYPPGTRSRPDYFPRRNRIISGLTQATLITEAGAGSGALHTANHAFEQGRDVYCVPGNVLSKQSEGTNQLIRENTARLVTTPEQLCEELNLLALGEQLPLGNEVRETETAAGATADEGKVLHWMEDGPKHIDEIVRSSGMAVTAVSSLLQMMALKGLVREVGPMTFERANM